ncbi:MAG: magnesium transporter CorA family protein [Bacteroidales bacterium]|nr:magnesium transporter CorA family protein [Bacteroidales bacterium]
MLTFWKQDNGLKPAQEYERDCWINVEEPTSAEIEQLVEEFKVPDYLINDILDADESSRTEVDGRWLVVILRIPIYQHDEDVPFFTIPLGILISMHNIVTICAQENEVIKDVIYSPKNRNLRLNDKVNFILQLFLSSSNFYLKYLKEINRITNDIESELEKSTKNKELYALLNMEKCLVFFMTSLKSNELLLNKLQRSKVINNEEINEDLLDDVTVEYKQALEITKVYSDIQNGRMDAFASVISNNLNVVMRRLTLITIVLMFPAMISGFFGMNIINGFENNPFAFWWIIGVTVFTSGLIFIFLNRSRFF